MSVDLTQPTCAICISAYTNPSSLECGHMYCTECAINLMKMPTPKCPKCNKKLSGAVKTVKIPVCFGGANQYCGKQPTFEATNCGHTLCDDHFKEGIKNGFLCPVQHCGKKTALGLRRIYP